MGENYLDDLDNKEIWCCDFFTTRINLQEPCLSLCHDTYVGQRKIGFLEGYSPEKYYEAMHNIVEDNEDENAHCRRCAKCKKQVYTKKKINWVTINTSWYCNSSCIYCHGHFASTKDGKEVLGVLEQFHVEKCFDTDCLFDWGGGEPTLNPIFEKTSAWITNNGYMQRINTNGIIYSNAVEKALKSDRTILRLSIDSGTKECFEKVKGTNHYDDVWNNIKKYRRYSDNIYIKYNVFNVNSKLEEIDAFIEKCAECKIKNIIIDSEVSSYQPDKNCGPFYYSEEAFKAMHYLKDKAEEMGFNVEISDYAFSYRPEYDEKGNLTLPSKYYDNLDKDVISNGILVETEPSVRRLIDELKKSKKQIIIRGYGIDGKAINTILQKEGVNVSYIVDKEFSGNNTNEAYYKSVESFLEETRDSIVLLAGKFWKEMLKEINDYNKKNFKVLYMNGYYYKKYLETMES